MKSSIIVKVALQNVINDDSRLKKIFKSAIVEVLEEQKDGIASFESS